MSLYSGFDSRILLDLLTLSAVVGYLIVRLNNSLISASSKGQIYGISCKLIVLSIGKAIKSDTYTKGNSHLITYVNSLDFFKNVELALLKLLDRLLSEYDKELILFYLL